MKTTLIKKLKLLLIAVVIVDLIALIFKYPTVYLGAFILGWSTHDLIGLIFKCSIIYVVAFTLVWSTYNIIKSLGRPKR